MLHSLLSLLSMLAIGAVLDNGIFGKAKNKLGNVVLFVWKGINAARSYVIPKNPNTPSQITQRNNMKYLVSFAQATLLPLIHKYWNPFVIKMSGYNAFIKANRDYFKSHPHDKVGVITKGNFPALEHYDFEPNNNKIVWNTTELPVGILETDKVGIVITNPDGSPLKMIDGIDISTGEYSLGFEPDHLTKIFCFTYREVNSVVTAVSNSYMVVVL